MQTSSLKPHKKLFTCRMTRCIGMTFNSLNHRCLTRKWATCFVTMHSSSRNKSKTGSTMKRTFQQIGNLLSTFWKLPQISWPWMALLPLQTMTQSTTKVLIAFSNLTSFRQKWERQEIKLIHKWLKVKLAPESPSKKCKRYHLMITKSSQMNLCLQQCQANPWLKLPVKMRSWMRALCWTGLLTLLKPNHPRPSLKRTRQSFARRSGRSKFWLACSRTSIVKSLMSCVMRPVD